MGPATGQCLLQFYSQLYSCYLCFSLQTPQSKDASENILHLPRSLPQQIGMFSFQQSAIHRGAAAKAFLRGAPRLMLAAVMFFQ